MTWLPAAGGPDRWHGHALRRSDGRNRSAGGGGCRRQWRGPPRAGRCRSAGSLRWQTQRSAQEEDCIDFRWMQLMISARYIRAYIQSPLPQTGVLRQRPHQPQCIDPGVGRIHGECGSMRLELSRNGFPRQRCQHRVFPHPDKHATDFDQIEPAIRMSHNRAAGDRRIHQQLAPVAEHGLKPFTPTHRHMRSVILVTHDFTFTLLQTKQSGAHSR